MPYQNSSSEDEQQDHTASFGRTGRRLVGRNPRRRRRGDDNDDNDNGNDNDNDDSILKVSQVVAESSTVPSQDTTEEFPYNNSTATNNSSTSSTTNTSSPTPQDSSPSQPTNQKNDNNHVILEDPDSDTLRILISTDNHLGFAETDNVRGNDSFAALEEVLYLAKEYSCDMVMLAGDLFHENRPSRRTLFKTSESRVN